MRIPLTAQKKRETRCNALIDDQVQRKGYRGHPISQADKDRNSRIAVTLAGGERPFATYKRHYGLA